MRTYRRTPIIFYRRVHDLTRETKKFDGWSFMAIHFLTYDKCNNWSEKRYSSTMPISHRDDKKYLCQNDDKKMCWRRINGIKDCTVQRTYIHTYMHNMKQTKNKTLSFLYSCSIYGIERGHIEWRILFVVVLMLLLLSYPFPSRKKFKRKAFHIQLFIRLNIASEALTWTYNILSLLLCVRYHYWY